MKSRSILRALALAATLLVSAAAQAQIFRAYLAIDGNDANPCTLPQPCRLLPAALNAVASGGEIWMLDSANYNTAIVNITKSVKILAVPGVVGSVVATGGPAISIATAGVNVALRNLVIVPLPGAGGTKGVHMTAGNSLTIDGILVADTPSAGIHVSGGTAVSVVNSTIRAAGGEGLLLENGARATVTRSIISAAGNYAIMANGNAAGTLTTVSVTDCTLGGSHVAVFALSENATATVRVAVRDSQVDRNNFGLYAYSSAGATVRLTSSGNLVTNTPNQAITAEGAGAIVWATANTVTDNGIGISAIGFGVFESAGDNAVRNNATNKSGITVIAKE